MNDDDGEIAFELGNKHIIVHMDNLYIMIRLLDGDFRIMKNIFRNM